MGCGHTSASRRRCPCPIWSAGAWLGRCAAWPQHPASSCTPWTDRAAATALPLLDEPAIALVVEVAATSELADVAPMQPFRQDRGRVLWLAADRTVAEALATNGAPRAHVVLTPGLVAEELVGRDRTTLRAALGAPADDRLVTLLPPVTRATDGLYAAWGVLLLSMANPHVRLLAPGHGPELERMRRLERACGRDGVLCYSGERLSPLEMIRVADAVLHTRTRGLPSLVMAQVRCVGRPVVTEDALERSGAPADGPWSTAAAERIVADRPRRIARALQRVLASCDTPSTEEPVPPRPASARPQKLKRPTHPCMRGPPRMYR